MSSRRRRRSRSRSPMARVRRSRSRSFLPQPSLQDSLINLSSPFLLQNPSLNPLAISQLAALNPLTALAASQWAASPDALGSSSLLGHQYPFIQAPLSPLSASSHVHKPVSKAPESYTCHRCNAKGHWIEDCPTKGDPRYDKAPKIFPEGYVCHRCNSKGHWIQECPTKGNPLFDKNKSDVPLMPSASLAALHSLLPNAQTILPQTILPQTLLPTPSMLSPSLYEAKRSVVTTKAPSTYTCHRCNEKGHWIQDCPTKGNPSYDKTSSSISKVPETYTCHRCNEKGHWIQDCPTKSDPRFDKK